MKYFLVFFGPRKSERNTMLHLRKAIKEGSVSNVLLLIQEYWNFLKLYLLSVQFVLSHPLHTLVHNKKPLNVTIIVANDVCCGIFVISFFFLMRHYCSNICDSICAYLMNEYWFIVLWFVGCFQIEVTNEMCQNFLRFSSKIQTDPDKL